MSTEREGRARLGAGGHVTIGPLVFHVKPLLVEAEVALADEFRRLAKEQMGPGGYYAESKSLLDWLAANELFADRAAIVHRIGDMTAKKELPSLDAAESARTTAEGVARELFYRTRDTHPDSTLADIRAIVNAVNAPSVHAAIKAAISADDDPKATPKF